MKVGDVYGAFKITWAGVYFTEGKCLKCGEHMWMNSPKLRKNAYACQKCGYKGGVENKVGGEK